MDLKCDSYDFLSLSLTPSLPSSLHLLPLLCVCLDSLKVERGPWKERKRSKRRNKIQIWENKKIQASQKQIGWLFGERRLAWESIVGGQVRVEHNDPICMKTHNETHHLVHYLNKYNRKKIMRFPEKRIIGVWKIFNV